MFHFMTVASPDSRFTRLRGVVAYWIVVTSVMLGVAPPSAWGQTIPQFDSSAATIEGRVEDIYQAGSVSLVEILVDRSEASRRAASAGLRYPSPGELIYVRVEDGSRRLPRTGTALRAHLRRSDRGRWLAAGEDWFGPVDGPDDGGSIVPPGDPPPTFGVTTDRERVGRDLVLRVTRVTAGSAAERAGVERGDLLVQADGAPLQNQQQLDAVYRRTEGNFELVVRDVRTGRNFRVAVKSDTPPAAEAGRESSNASMQPLGLTTELAFYSGEPAAKVTAVQPRSQAADKGIRVGTLILKLNGAPISDPKELNSLFVTAKGVVLQVFDPDDRETRTVRLTP